MQHTSVRTVYGAVVRTAAGAQIAQVAQWHKVATNSTDGQERPASSNLTRSRAALALHGCRRWLLALARFLHRCSGCILAVGIRSRLSCRRWDRPGLSILRGIRSEGHGLPAKWRRHTYCVYYVRGRVQGEQAGDGRHESGMRLHVSTVGNTIQGTPYSVGIAIGLSRSRMGIGDAISGSPD
jgi:hypothetical protein